MKNIKQLIIPTLSCLIIAIAVEFKPYFMLWNILPIIGFYYATRNYFIGWKQLKAVSVISLVILTITLLLLPTSISLLWILNIGTNYIGSADGENVFFFVPLFALLLSIIPFVTLLLSSPMHSLKKD